MYEENETFGMHRSDAVDTSIDAAESMLDVLTETQNVVYEAIWKLGSDGGISDEICELLPDMRYQTVTPRYRALLDKGLITDTGERRLGKSGRQQRVMRATIWNLI
jgi:DNA-binding transcriptional ArsR family regulator